MDKEKTETLIEEKKPKTIIEKLDSIDQKIVDMSKPKKTKKPYKLKYKSRRKLKKLYKKNQILVLIMTVSGGLDSAVYPIESGTFTHNGIPRRFNLKHIFKLEGKYPCVLLPEWAVEPIAFISSIDDTESNTREKPLIGYENYIKSGLPSSYAIGWLIAKIKSSEVATKKGFSGKTWVIIGLVGIAAVYILFSGVGQ